MENNTFTLKKTQRQGFIRFKAAIARQERLIELIGECYEQLTLVDDLLSQEDYVGNDLDRWSIKETIKHIQDECSEVVGVGVEELEIL